MRIKRYLARDMQEAYLAIRRDLGPEAVIVATRQVRQPGLKGFFLPSRLEVTAAVETLTEANSLLALGRKSLGARTLLPDTAGEHQTADQAGAAGHISRPGYGLWPGIEILQRELGEIKAAISRLKSCAEVNVPAANLSWRQRLLLEQELEQELVNSLLDGIEDIDDMDIVSDIIRTRLADYLASRVTGESRQRVQVFIGPTGVGKTTTLAKLAARYNLYREQKVGLITLDTYRIGAVDQLRTYAEIMSLPLEVAMTPREFKEALDRLHACDVILVDTAGRAPDNKAMLAEMRGFLDVAPEREVYLVMSCANRCRDLLYALEKFRSFNYDRLIFTKLDETTCPGAMVTVTATAGVPISYIATGQNVPQDLEPAEPYFLAQRIWEAVVKDGSGGQVA